MMTLVLISYFAAAALLAVYGINCHVMIHLFKRRIAGRRLQDQRLLQDFYDADGYQRLPVVTTQLPIFNELNVAERVIEAVAAFVYPEGKHAIQVLDDSTDETFDIVARKVKELQGKGVPIEHIHRSIRTGFKAGALREGMARAKGELIAIFDADFVPPPDFLLKAAPYFTAEKDLGLVQGRWDHLNAGESLITRLQSIGINGHFMVEQSARSWNGLFMNFNGTAGVFRKQAIIDAGNWHDDTLTEDMDLSYRMQLRGWKCRYLIDLVAPAEVPRNINAFKNQQFRWAKGSIQTAMKLLPDIWRSRCTPFMKLQATLHMTHYLVHPLMAYVAVMALPLLLASHLYLPPLLFGLLVFLLVLSCTGPSRLYWTAERQYTRGLSSRLWLLPVLICFGCGLAINNSRAVLEAVWGKQSAFIRTPKRGHAPKKSYRPSIGHVFVLEIISGFWCLLGTSCYFQTDRYLVGHFLLIYTIGFFYIGLTSLLHSRRSAG